MAPIHAGQAGLEKTLVRFVEGQGDATIGDFLDEAGARVRPDTQAWADLLWPFVKKIAASDVVRDFVDGVTGEFYDSLARPD